MIVINVKHLSATVFLYCLDELLETEGRVLDIKRHKHQNCVSVCRKYSKCMLQIVLCFQKLFMQLTKSASKKKMPY